MASLPERALAFDRREGDRTLIARPAVLCLNAASHPIRVEDLTRNGCKITTEIDLQVGSPVSLRFAGVGRTEAEVVWSSSGSYGCVFDEPLRPGAVTAATRNNVDHFSGPDAQVRAVAPSEVKWSPRSQVLAIAGGAAIAWAAVIAVVLIIH